MSLGVLLYTKLFGKLVGTDTLGNSYYESHHKRWFGKKNRWVIYHKKNKYIANIDTNWFKWLHYLSDIPPIKITKMYNWIIECGLTEYYKHQYTTKNSKMVYDEQYSSWNY